MSADNDDDSSPSSHSANNQKPNHYLTNYLKSQFNIVEPLPDMTCPNCQRSSAGCGDAVWSNCQREQWLIHVPKHLVIYIQRADWNSHRNRTVLDNANAVKRSDYVHIPDQLDMAQNLMPVRATIARRRLMRHQTERFKMDQTRRYSLTSVVVHQGALLQSGHYITYRKWPTTRPHLSSLDWFSHKLSFITTTVCNFFQGIPFKKPIINSPWLLTSDLSVTRVSVEEVQTSPAYLLFYDRIFDDSSLTTDDWTSGCNNELLQVNGSLGHSSIDCMSFEQMNNHNHISKHQIRNESNNTDCDNVSTANDIRLLASFATLR